MNRYKFLFISAALAIVMGSILPIFNATVSYPLMIQFMKNSIEREAVNAAHLIVEKHPLLTTSTSQDSLSSVQIEAVLGLKEHYQMMRIRVFDEEGRILYSTVKEEIGSINQNDYFHQQVARGQTVNKLVTKDAYSLDGKKTNLDVAEVYVPVMNGKRFMGAFEFYFDISNQKAEIDSISQTSLKVFIFVILGFLCVVCLLAIKMRQAITKQVLAEKEILKMAYTDILTGLPNRRLLLDRIDQALARAQRYQTQVGLLYMDVDNFKNVNDALGHKEGDLLLKKIAMEIGKRIRKSDTLARIGGDEFVLLVPDLTSPEEAEKIAKELNEKPQKTYDNQGSIIAVTLSIGVAVYPLDGMNTDTLLLQADKAMYQAKKKGRNTFCCAAEEKKSPL